MNHAMIGISRSDMTRPVKVPETMKVTGRYGEVQKGLPLEKARRSPV